MTVSELIRELGKLPADFEIAVFTANAHARPPSIVRVNQFAWTNQGDVPRAGLHDPSRAYLLRPEQEIV